MIRTSVAMIALVALLPSVAGAQQPAPPFNGINRFVGAHVGMSAYGSAAALGASAEIPVNRHIGIGAWGETWSYGETYNYSFGQTYSWNIRYVSLAGTGAYHIDVPSQPKLDPFLGLALGYFIVSNSGESGGFEYTGKSSRMFLGGFGGVRYMFKQNLAGVARLGFGSSYLSVGVDLKM